MSGEVFTPKRIIIRGKVTELLVPGEGGSLDSAVDAQTDQQALAGAFTRTIYADPPGAFIFVCHCGFKRRVTYSETNFRCERGGVGPACQCPILWCRKLKDSGEVDDYGQPIMVDDTVDELVEIVEEFSGKRKKVKVPRPQFIGRMVGELRAEEMRRRVARGEPAVANPTNEVNKLQYETSKQQFDRKKAEEAKRVKE